MAWHYKRLQAPEITNIEKSTYGSEQGDRSLKFFKFLHSKSAISFNIFVGPLDILTCLSVYMYEQNSKCTDKPPKRHYLIVWTPFYIYCKLFDMHCSCEKMLYRVSPPPPPKKKKKKKKNGTVDFSELCSDQQLSFFTLLDRVYFPHYYNINIWLRTFYLMSNFLWTVIFGICPISRVPRHN